MLNYHCKRIKDYCDNNFKWGKDKKNLIELTQKHIDNYSKVCTCNMHQPERSKREDICYHVGDIDSCWKCEKTNPNIRIKTVNNTNDAVL